MCSHIASIIDREDRNSPGKLSPVCVEREAVIISNALTKYVNLKRSINFSSM